MGHTFQLILDKYTKEYSDIKKRICRQQNIAAEDIDLEVFLMLYIIANIDERSNRLENDFFQLIAKSLSWSKADVKKYEFKTLQKPKFDLNDFIYSKTYPELAKLVYALSYTYALVDGERLHPDEEMILNSIQNHLFPYDFESTTETIVSDITSIIKTPKLKQVSNESSNDTTRLKENVETQTKENKSIDDPADNLEDCLNELHSLVGLKQVKDEIERLVRFLRVQQIRESQGLPALHISLHMVFTGNPGTGKTTVARIVAKVFKAMKILEKGHLIETDRSGLVASYVGQTAEKTIAKARQALDGILFIDEAYALTKASGTDFGKEAIDTLVKYMEDHRDRLIVIVAGYKDEMKEFIQTNPGLKSRFATFINFDDYSTNELMNIFQISCDKHGYQLTAAATESLQRMINYAVSKNEKGFGNGRFIRNIFEKMLKNQAFRLMDTNNPVSKDELITLTEADIPESG